jgi:hypothetical protein
MGAAGAHQHLGTVAVVHDPMIALPLDSPYGMLNDFGAAPSQQELVEFVTANEVALSIERTEPTAELDVTTRPRPNATRILAR